MGTKPFSFVHFVSELLSFGKNSLIEKVELNLLILNIVDIVNFC